MARVNPQMRQLYAMCATALVLGRADLDGADEAGFDIDLPVFTVGQVGQLAAIHPQTLRQYDRVGLVVPGRTEGGARRYSLRDVERLVEAQRLSQSEGINLAGVTRILALQEENRQLKRQVRRMQMDDGDSVFAAGRDGSIVEMQRSASARNWRRAIHTHARELPSRAGSMEDSMETGQAGRPRRSAQSQSMVLWGYR